MSTGPMGTAAVPVPSIPPLGRAEARQLASVEYGRLVDAFRERLGAADGLPPVERPRDGRALRRDDG